MTFISAHLDLSGLWQRILDQNLDHQAEIRALQLYVLSTNWSFVRNTWKAFFGGHLSPTLHNKKWRLLLLKLQQPPDL